MVGKVGYERIEETRISKKKNQKGWMKIKKLLKRVVFAAKKARLEKKKQTGESVITAKNAETFKANSRKK